MLLAIITSSCSAGFSKPKAESLAEVDGTIHAFIDPDPNRNTDKTIPRQQYTIDGTDWFPADNPTSATEGVTAQPGADVAMECDERSASCYRVTSPNAGIRLERSADDGATWDEVWTISASRLDFQDKCCGSRRFLIRDLEYVPETGLVAVSLSEYGLLTRGTDGVIRLESRGRPDRPESGLMVGRYIEPLYAAVLALGLGWITAEHSLNRLRNDVERRLGSDDHTWITSRSRQVPILPPVMFFVGIGAVGAALAGLPRRLPETTAGTGMDCPCRRRRRERGDLGWWTLAAPSSVEGRRGDSRSSSVHGRSEGGASRPDHGECG